MATTIENRRTQPTTAAHGDELPEVVSDRASAEPALRGTAQNGLSNEATLWRGALIGAALGFAFFALAIAIAATASGFAPVSALGIGAFVGLWGGLGFGMMMGGAFAFHGMPELNEPAMTLRGNEANIAAEAESRELHDREGADVASP
jgi:hypothetical protein